MSAEYEYKLSVVVLVYNTEYYLEKCLDSLVNQTLDDIEIICVNDESTDNSLNILRRYARKHDNIKIIDQKNQGGAIAGNNGLKIAKGEYVALVDSDDILVEDAYEKLYKKAKETDSDIVAGKPNILLSGFQREISHKNNIWNEERTFTVDEFINIYHDVFYWNKIYRREFVEKHDIYMIPGKIYADVPLVYRAYSFADKISIITDVVYYWRKRSIDEISQGNSETSVSKSLLDIDNMKDRLATYYYLKDYFKEANREEIFNTVIKMYMERFFYPINGILKDENFKNAYLKEFKAILSDIDEIYENSLDLKYNIFIYFILHDMDEDLEDFLNFYLNEKDTKEKDGKLYWDIKYFDNPEYNIPDEIFEIKRVEDRFIELDGLYIDKKFLNIEYVRIPETIKIKDAKICFMGLSKIDTLKYDNIHKFSLIQDESVENLFKVKIPVKDFEKININTYDIYLEFTYANGESQYFRLKEMMFINEMDKRNLSDIDEIKPHFTQLGNFSIINAYSKNIFKIECDEEKMKVIPLFKGDANYRLYFNHWKVNERVFLKKYNNEEEPLKKEFEVKWKYSLDENIPYTLHIKINKKTYKLTTKYTEGFKNEEIEFNGKKISVFKDTDQSISIRLK